MISLTPYLQPDKLGDYQDKVVQLYRADAALNRMIPASIRDPVEDLLRIVNCYYSNKIEGNPTHPKSLLEAWGESKTVADSSPAIGELFAHLEAQLKAEHASVSLSEVIKQDFIKNLHESFYSELPASQLIVKNHDGTDALNPDGSPLLVVPGEYRLNDVKVGKHIPPGHEELAGYMHWLEQMFNPERIHGTAKVNAAAALHHRLAWIHPFQDGNGRVIRLLTDCYMRCAGFGGYGLWSITRGFGRNTQAYYSALAQADKPRQGDSDGRGILSDSGLLYFTRYFIDTALDQVNYFTELLDPEKIHVRIDVYFDHREKNVFPGKDQPLKNPLFRQIYKLLLDKGPMPRSAIGNALGKAEQTLRPVFKQMAADGLISAEPKKDIKLKLAGGSIDVLFPQLW